VSSSKYSMQRRSLSENAGRRYPAPLPNHLSISDVKGHKRRTTSYAALWSHSNSTIVTFCSLAVILFLTIQAKIYLDTIVERKPVIIDIPHPSPLLSDDDAKQRHHTPLHPRSKDTDTRTVVQFTTLPKHQSIAGDRESQNDIRDGKLGHRGSGATVGRDNRDAEHENHVAKTSPQQHPQPRIVRFELQEPNSHSSRLPFKSSLGFLRKDLLSDESDSGPTDKIPLTEKTEDAVFQKLNNGTDTTITTSINISTFVETEDEDTTGEDKEQIQDEKNGDGGNENEEECVPMAKWQTSVPVNCNSIHEVDILSSILNQGGSKTKSRKIAKTALLSNSSTTQNNIHLQPLYHPTWNGSQLTFLGQGWFRAAWKLDLQTGIGGDDDDDNEGSETVILKMLRPERDFTSEFYEVRYGTLYYAFHYVVP